MDNKKRIQEEVERTLNSLEGIRRTEANPYLFTRIKAGLDKDEKNLWNKTLAFISRPSIVLPAIILATFVNTAIFFQFRSENKQTSKEAEQVFASEYNLSDNTIYESTIEPDETIHPK